MKSLRSICLATVLFIYVLCLGGCQTTESFLMDQNSPPVILFEEGKEVLEDSVKIGIKVGIGVYKIDVMLSDADNNMSLLTAMVKVGEGKFLYEADYHDTLSITLLSEVVTMGYLPKITGKHEIEIVLWDSFQTKSLVVVSLEAFNNLLPEALLSVKYSGVESPYHYTFDGSLSIDKDEKWGGEISRYSYHINDLIIIEESDRIEWDFGSPGVYRVGLTVQDNDGGWSEKVEFDFTVN